MSLTTDLAAMIVDDVRNIIDIYLRRRVKFKI